MQLLEPPVYGDLPGGHPQALIEREAHVEQRVGARRRAQRQQHACLHRREYALDLEGEEREGEGENAAFKMKVLDTQTLTKYFSRYSLQYTFFSSS